MVSVEQVVTKGGANATLLGSGVVLAVVEGRGRFAVKSVYVGSAAEAARVDFGQYCPGQSDHDDRAAAEAELADLVDDYRQRVGLARIDVPHGSRRTPSGIADSAQRYGEGIVFLGTPSHGYFKLDAKANAKVDPLLRQKGGWYEEDVEWAVVAFTFPELFTDRESRAALRTLKNYRPDQTGVLTGKEVLPEESTTLRERAFASRNRDRLVVIAALIGDHGMVDCVATVGGRRGEGGEREFKVPKAEYATREPYGFVIDESRHEEVAASSPGMR